MAKHGAYSRIALFIALFAMMCLTIVSADQMAFSGGTSTTATQTAIGAYHWSCFNFSSNVSALSITKVQTYISSNSGLNGTGSAVGIYSANATGEPNKAGQIGGNTTNITLFNLGFLNWTWSSNNPVVNTNTQYWACWYTGSSSFIRVGETAAGGGRRIWARTTSDNLGTVDTSPVVDNVNMQVFGNPSVSYAPSFYNFSDNSNNFTYNATANTQINATFSVSVNNTSGTILLNFNGVNYTASTTDNVNFNYTLKFNAAGNFSYSWMGYGTGPVSLFNQSALRYYIVNAVPTPFYWYIPVDTNSTSNVLLFAFIALLIALCYFFLNENVALFAWLAWTVNTAANGLYGIAIIMALMLLAGAMSGKDSKVKH